MNYKNNASLSLTFHIPNSDSWGCSRQSQDKRFFVGVGHGSSAYGGIGRTIGFGNLFGESSLYC